MKNLTLLRKSHNLTMKELAKILNLSESTISLYENGKRQPDFNILNKIAEYFNVSVDYLLGREEKSKIENNPKAEDFTEYIEFPENIRVAARNMNRLHPKDVEALNQLIKTMLDDEDDEQNT